MPKNDPDIEELLGPVTDKKVRKYKELGPLHDLLLKACPPNEHGERSIPILAKYLDMSSWGVFKWIKNNKLPPRQAMKIVELSEGKVTIDQFSPYIFK
jgi:hypothetical protein